MEIKELSSQKQDELQPAIRAGDMEAVEALMSMSEHWKTRSLRLIRPLTPSSDYSEDDPSPTVRQGSPLVGVNVPSS